MTALIAIDPLEVIGMILKSEMSLADGQVMFGLEKFDINQDPGLFIALQYVNSMPVGNNNYAISDGENVGDGMTEIQQVAMTDIIQIDAMSFNSEARTKRAEILMALRSIYSQQLQDQYSMKISRIPQSFVAMPTLEETKFLNRFVLRVFVNSIYTKSKAVDYFDTFKDVEVHTNG